MESVHISVTTVELEKKMLKSSKFMNCRESFRMLQLVQERRKLTLNKPYLSLNKLSIFRKSLIPRKVEIQSDFLEYHLNNDLYISQQTLLCLVIFSGSYSEQLHCIFLVAASVSPSFSYSCQVYYNGKNSDYKIDIILLQLPFKVVFQVIIL